KRRAHANASRRPWRRPGQVPGGAGGSRAVVADSTWDRPALESILAQALSLVDEGEAEALFTARDAALTRFANSRIHQNVADRDATLRMRVVRDGRTGV